MPLTVLNTAQPAVGADHPLPSPSPEARAADLRLALRLIYLTLGWMVVEAGASLTIGWIAGSLLLEAFGIDSLIEIISAAVLWWRLRAELHGAGDEAAINAIERRAARLAGALLLALAAYVILNSAYGLFAHHATDTHTSAWGILIGVVATIGMPLVARGKLRIAARINSRALRADAMESLTCGYLSIVLIIGLGATRLLGWWWLDCVAALALVPLLVKEGREAMKGGCSCSACP